MIEVKFHGTTWEEVEQQIAGMIRGEQADTNPALEKENRKLQTNLSDAQLIIERLEEELAESALRIEGLEKQLSEVEKENPTPAPASEPEPVTTAPNADTATEQPTYKKEEVRAFLASAREAGVDITKVLKPFGGRLPAVKEEDYPALMEAAKAALAEVKEKK